MICDKHMISRYPCTMCLGTLLLQRSSTRRTFSRLQARTCGRMTVDVVASTSSTIVNCTSICKPCCRVILARCMCALTPQATSLTRLPKLNKVCVQSLRKWLQMYQLRSQSEFSEQRSCLECLSTQIVVQILNLTLVQQLHQRHRQS